MFDSTKRAASTIGLALSLIGGATLGAHAGETDATATAKANFEAVQKENLERFSKMKAEQEARLAEQRDAWRDNMARLRAKQKAALAEAQEKTILKTNQALSAQEFFKSHGKTAEQPAKAAAAKAPAVKKTVKTAAKPTASKQKAEKQAAKKVPAKPVAAKPAAKEQAAKSAEKKPAASKKAAVTIPTRKPVSRQAARSEFDHLIAKYAAEEGVPLKLAHAVVMVESTYRAHVTGRAGEIGLMQLKPATARLMGYKGSAKGLYHPATNLKYGMKYLGKARRLAKGSLCGTILRYNAGHGAKRMNPVSANYCKKVQKHI